MLKFYINSDSSWTDVSENIIWDSLRVQETIQEQNNTADFSAITIRPFGGQEIRVFDGAALTETLSSVGRTLSIADTFDDVNKFRAGDRVWINPTGATEEYATVSSAATGQIILTQDTANTHSMDEIVGKKKFAGHILRTPDHSGKTSGQIDVDVQCVDYTRLFNRRLVNNEWTDSSALTIIRSILNDPVNDGLTTAFTASTDDVDIGATFSDFRAPFKSPSAVMQELADQVGGYFWYIDYDMRVHFGPSAQEIAPFNLTPTSDNYDELSVQIDLSQLKNQQIVLGGYEFNDATTTEIKAGDGVAREWVLRNKMKNLDVFIGTDSTSVATTVSVLPDFINAEGSADYFSNFQGQSVRAGQTTSTLTTGWYIRFVYNEQIPIETISRDDASVAALKALGFGDGLVDGRPIVDSNLDTRAEAQARADAEIKKYANTIINISFITDQEGLHPGQVIGVQDTRSQRGIDTQFLIQKVGCSIYGGANSKYNVQAASSLFGINELISKLLKRDQDLFVDKDAVIRRIALWQENLGLTESWEVTDPVTWTESLGMTESWSTRIVTPPFTWGVSSTLTDAVWNLSEWS